MLPVSWQQLLRSSSSCGGEATLHCRGTRSRSSWCELISCGHHNTMLPGLTPEICCHLVFAGGSGLVNLVSRASCPALHNTGSGLLVMRSGAISSKPPACCNLGCAAPAMQACCLGGGSWQLGHSHQAVGCAPELPSQQDAPRHCFHVGLWTHSSSHPTRTVASPGCFAGQRSAADRSVLLQ